MPPLWIPFLSSPKILTEPLKELSYKFDKTSPEKEERRIIYGMNVHGIKGFREIFPLHYNDPFRCLPTPNSLPSVYNVHPIDKFNLSVGWAYN